MRLSYANLAATATITASTTFVNAGFPATNVQLFGRPHIRAYSTNTSAQRLTLDFGSTTTLEHITLFHPNFATVTIQGNATDTWGTPGYTSGLLTMGRSGTGRYHHIHRPTVAVPFSRRFLSFSIPSQATTDGAAFFKLGSILAGLLVVPPRGIRLKNVETKKEARKDIETEDGRLLQRLMLGEPQWLVRAMRQAANETELAAWREIDRRWAEAPGQAALVHWRDIDLSDVYLMRRVDDAEWPHDAMWSESEMEAVELIAG